MGAISEVRERALLRLKLRQEIARVSDGYYQTAEKIARQMRKELKTAQIRGLENVAYTTDKVSDIFDLIKRQVGRSRWPIGLGEELLRRLNEQRNEAERIAKSLNPDDDDLPRLIHLLLCREFIKHLATHFVYMDKVEKSEKGE